MNPHSPTAPSRGNKTRRTVDAAALALFHVAVFGVLVWAHPKDLTVWGIACVAVLVGDVAYFLSPPKQKARLDPAPEPASPHQTAPVSAFALELVVLLVPPLAFIAWLLSLVWQRETLTWIQLLIIVLALPTTVGLVTQIIKFRLTRIHVGIVNPTTKFIASSMLGTWIGALFFFIIFLVGLLVKIFLP